jgi:hypothetical protein
MNELSMPMPMPIGGGSEGAAPSTIKDYLFNIGRSYTEGGIDGALLAMNSDPVAKGAMTPQHIEALALSDKKKLDTPEHIAVAGLAGGLNLTNKTEELARQSGLNLQNPAANGPEQVGTFTQGIKQLLATMKVDPNSPEAEANQAYFGALTRGSGIKGAVNAYTQVYQKAVDRDAQLRNTVLTETIKRDIKLQETQQLQRQFTETATRTLASSGLDTGVIPQLATQIGQVLVTAKENPALAVGGGQAILQNLIDAKAPTETINKVAGMLSKAVPVSKEDADQVRALEAAGASDRLIARYRFGLQDAKDAREAQSLLDAEAIRQTKQKNKLELEKHAAQKSIDVASEISKEKQLMPLKIQQAGLEEQAKEAGKVLGTMPGLKDQINDINKAVAILDSGKHNVGSGLSVIAGRGKIAQAIGSQFETEDAKNTNLVMDTVNKLAADGLKSLGANPSTVDLQFWTANKPNASSSPEFVKEWIQGAQVKIANRAGWAQHTLGQKPTPVAPSAPDSKKPETPRVRKFNPQTGALE